jgi:hypothetical protein
VADFPDSDESRAYLKGWAALSRLMASGSSWSGREKNNCYVNLGDGRFAEASFVIGLGAPEDGRAVAAVDWEGDGDLDLWFRNRTGPQLRFMRNEGAREDRFIAFHLTGTTSNRDAVGARVDVDAGGRVFSRTVVSGDGYLSQSSRWLHFGLKDTSSIDRVVIRWPGGEPEEIGGVEPDRRYRVTQGTGRAVAVAAREIRAGKGVGEPILPLYERVLLRTPLQMPPSLTARVNEGAGPGRAKLVNLWAHWCVPCSEELSRFAAAYPDLQVAGLDVVPLSVDAPEDLDRAAAWFEEWIAPRMPSPGFGFRTIAPDEAESLDAILRHVLDRRGEMVVPTSLLIDSRGFLQMIYLGPVDPDDLLADAEIWALSPVKGSRRGLFPGRRYFRAPRNLGALAADLRERGRRDDARFYYALQELRGAEKARRDAP